MSDNELGAFIRASREAVTPAEAGLPPGLRRRTPGLRRSELATLAGISVEYLTRLEQGRDRRPSPQVLGALADALRLTARDRLHLRYLAKAADGDSFRLCPASAPPSRAVRPTVRALLERLEPTPAVLLNRLNDVLARTEGYERLAGPVGLLDGDPPNLTRFVFADPRARAAYPDWEHVADERVAAANLYAGGDDQHAAELAAELSVTAGAAFTRRLTGPPLRPRPSGVERLVHPGAGELRLAYETLALPDVDGQRLVTYLPADDATAAALATLSGRPRQQSALRVVTG